MTDEELVKRPLDEEFDTMMEVQRDPYGAWQAIQILTEQLEAARADAKEAEGYAEELEAKVKNLTVHHANMADPRYWEGRYRDEKAKLAKAVELLKEARQDLEEYVTHEWPKDEHPVYERKWDRDMELCRRIDATLAEIEGAEP